MQRVEGVEELLLRLLLALQELDVVDQQDIHLTVTAPEFGSPVLADRVDEVVGQLFGGDVPNPNPVEVVPYVVPERMQQVGLAQTRVAVDGQRVVGLARVLSDGYGSGVGEPVRSTDDERLKGVLRIKPGVGFSAQRLTFCRLDGRPAELLRNLRSGPAVAVDLRSQTRRRRFGLQGIVGLWVCMLLTSRQSLVHLDEQLDGAVEELTQLSLYRLPEPALQLGASKSVGRRDQQRIPIETERLRHRQPGSQLRRGGVVNLLPGHKNRIGITRRGLYHGSVTSLVADRRETLAEITCRSRQRCRAAV